MLSLPLIVAFYASSAGRTSREQYYYLRGKIVSWISTDYSAKYALSDHLDLDIRDQTPRYLTAYYLNVDSLRDQ